MTMTDGGRDQINQTKPLKIPKPGLLLSSNCPKECLMSGHISAEGFSLKPTGRPV